MPQAPLPTFGITTAPMQVSYQDILRVWREADAIPEIEHAWLFDHLMPIAGDPSGPIFEGWTLLSALAAQLPTTSRAPPATALTVTNAARRQCGAPTAATCYWISVITRCAETGLVPPATGVIVNAVELPAGLRTVRVESTAVVCTRAISTSWLVPVARPTTV